MFGGWNQFQKLADPGCLLQPDGLRGYFTLSRFKAGGFADFIADENSFERYGRLSSLMGNDLAVKRGDDFTSGSGLVIEIREVLLNLMGDGEASLQTLGLAKLAH